MSSRARFSIPVIALHWLTLALLVLVFASAELREIFPKGSTGRAGLRHWHEVVGLLVFGLVWVRLLARTFSRAPSIQPMPPRWQALLATAVHVGLYGLMIVLPLSGWVMLNADGKAVTWFGFELPTLVAASRPLAHRIKEVHEALASAGYALIGVHAAAALFHHYVIRDNALRLMLPSVARFRS